MRGSSPRMTIVLVDMAGLDVTQTACKARAACLRRDAIHV